MASKDQEYERILSEANQAKDRLYNVAEQLREIGKIRKANSLMTLIYNIEEWQNRR